MRKFISIVIAYPFVSILLFSCNNKGSEKSFASKSDSIQFAKSVLKQYPSLSMAPNLNEDSISGFKPGNGMQPITWDTVMSYKTYYDKNPKLFNLMKQPYKGFSVDPAGYSMIFENKNIKGLYLRLGRKGDGAYTIMILGTDSTGNVINTSAFRAAPLDSTNFDNLNTCPDNCPDIDN